MVETARKTHLAGIPVVFNIILGYPGETEAQRQQTFRVMSGIAKEYPNISFSPNIFTPYPGIPIWPQLKEMGVREPQSLEEWETLALGTNVLPWLRGEELRRLRRSLEYFLLNNQIRKVTRKIPWARRSVQQLLGAPVRWRIGKSRYSFPWELWLSRAVEKVVTRQPQLPRKRIAHFLRTLGQRLPSQKRTSGDDFLHGTRQPQLPRKRIAALADSPTDGRSK